MGIVHDIQTSLWGRGYKQPVTTIRETIQVETTGQANPAQQRY